LTRRRDVDGRSDGISLVTGQDGVLPDFIIVGAQKAGTTSLHAYLMKHPQVKPPVTKEVHYFDTHYHRGDAWYRSFFPSLSHDAADGAPRMITGEASPYYFYHPAVPARVASTVPTAKLIALLREPVSRAYSHYQMEHRKGLEDLSFEEAIEAEAERLDGEDDRLLRDERYKSRAHRHHSYLSRGIYADQILRWRSVFPVDQMLILKAEDLRTATDATLDRVLDFLDLPRTKLRIQAHRNVGTYPPMNSDTREKLVDYFRPANQRLYDVIGTSLWD